MGRAKRRSRTSEFRLTCTFFSFFVRPYGPSPPSGLVNALHAWRSANRIIPPLPNYLRPLRPRRMPKSCSWLLSRLPPTHKTTVNSELHYFTKRPFTKYFSTVYSFTWKQCENTTNLWLQKFKTMSTNRVWAQKYTEALDNSKLLAMVSYHIKSIYLVVVLMQNIKGAGFTMYIA